MGTARNMVQRVRVNVDELLYLLAQCAVRELEIFYYYTIFNPRLIDPEGTRLHKIIEKARMEDRMHFERLVLFISEMGGEFPVDFREFPQLSDCSARVTAWDHSDEKMILKVLNEAEKCAVQTYTNICHLTEGKDLNTYRLASSLLEEDLLHERELHSFLEPKPRPLRKRSLMQNFPAFFSYCISDLSVRLSQGGQTK